MSPVFLVSGAFAIERSSGSIAAWPPTSVVVANITRNADEAITARSDVAPSRPGRARTAERRRGRGSALPPFAAANHDGCSAGTFSANSMAA
jgi:hypothetical protein